MTPPTKGTFGEVAYLWSKTRMDGASADPLVPPEGAREVEEISELTELAVEALKT